jgi:hypothetical protein
MQRNSPWERSKNSRFRLENGGDLEQSISSIVLQVMLKSFVYKGFAIHPKHDSRYAINQDILFTHSDA